jgi:hypothetical protein
MVPTSPDELRTLRRVRRDRIVTPRKKGEQAMLSGNLELFALEDVLRFVARSGATGAVNVYRQVDGGRFLLSKGEIVGASIDAFDAVDSDGVLEAGLRLLDGGAGDFALEVEDVDGPVREAVDDFLKLVARRRVEWSKIISAVGSLDDPLSVEAQLPAEATEITLSPLEWQIAVLADGRRSLRDLATEAGTSDFAVAQALLAMSNAGLLGLAGGEIDADLGDELDDDEPVVYQGVGDDPPAIADDGGSNEDVDPADLLRELGEGGSAPPRARRLTAATREEQRLRLRSR